MSFGLVTVSAFVFYFLVDRYAAKKRQQRSFTYACPPPLIEPSDIVVHGRDLNLAADDLHRILQKRFWYYRQLNQHYQQVFVFRLQVFLARKTFIIKASEGVREMPVLVSASAVQLTFGLPDFTLSFYRYIRIYPAEFVSEDFTKILVGNVTSNIITVAWTHFLDGYQDEQDGANLGLHEMSHALYFQKIEVEAGYAKTFAKQFRHLFYLCQHAFESEVAGHKNLYSAYAEKDLQEFWAESVELFFEKPALLREHYHLVFDQMLLLLNQDPARKEAPIVNRGKAFPLYYRSYQSVTQARFRFSKNR